MPAGLARYRWQCRRCGLEWDTHSHEVDARLGHDGPVRIDADDWSAPTLCDSCFSSLMRWWHQGRGDPCQLG